MVIYKVAIRVIKILARINTKKYMGIYTSLLRRLGVNIPAYDGTGYIDPTCFIDSSDYRLITIGKHVTISRNTTLLTHDFSIGKGLESINKTEANKRYKFLKEIKIGDDVFIGLNAIILPGTNIGKNCIIGSGTVVKGDIPDYSVVVGNPGKVVSDIRQWAERHVEKQDYFIC